MPSYDFIVQIIKMIKWLKKNQTNVPSQPEVAELIEDETSKKSEETPANMFTRLRRSLSKTRHHLGEGVARLLLGKKQLDATLLEELENLLLTADLGIEMTQKLLDNLHSALKRSELADGDAAFTHLKKQLLEVLSNSDLHLTEPQSTPKPLVILMVGVNGAGKTTTIGKLAKQYQLKGKKVMLAAGDTFRAAAVEQLQVWGERNQIPVIAQHTGADSASVIYDAFQAAKAREIDILIADTAGRLHTQHHLMDELRKVKRVLQKIDPSAPHEIILVLDASIGQNALNQARQFHDAVGLTGMVMTKLDGTAKGGILFAMANELKIPFRYIGIGEGIDDLRPFDAAQFVDALFHDDHLQPS